jgi:hypothetical protein
VEGIGFDFGIAAVVFFVVFEVVVGMRGCKLGRFVVLVRRAFGRALRTWLGPCGRYSCPLQMKGRI